MNAPMDTRLKVERNGDVKIIRFTGNNFPSLGNALAGELEGHTDDIGQCHLLLDFTNVEFICGVELGTLIGLHTRIGAGGGRLTLFNLSANVFEVFIVNRLQMLLQICREGPANAKIRNRTNRLIVGHDAAKPKDPWRDVGGEA